MCESGYRRKLVGPEILPVCPSLLYGGGPHPTTFFLSMTKLFSVRDITYSVHDKIFFSVHDKTLFLLTTKLFLSMTKLFSVHCMHNSFLSTAKLFSVHCKTLFCPWQKSFLLTTKLFFCPWQSYFLSTAKHFSVHDKTFLLVITVWHRNGVTENVAVWAGFRVVCLQRKWWVKMLSHDLCARTAKISHLLSTCVQSVEDLPANQATSGINTAPNEAKRFGKT